MPTVSGGSRPTRWRGSPRLLRTSIVYESQYVWGDDDWMWYRGQKAMHAEPVSVYEVHIGSWRRGSPTSSWPTNWSSTSAGRATRM